MCVSEAGESASWRRFCLGEQFSALSALCRIERNVLIGVAICYFSMRLRHTIPGIIAVSATLSLVRVAVLFAESWAAVRAERVGDAALLQICEEQTLASSDKFRNACLAARADSAAPVLLKTLMRAVHTAFTDFCEAFNTPSRLCLLILFLLSGVSAPIVKSIVTTLLRGATAKDSDCDTDQESTRVIFVGSPGFQTKQSPWARLRHRVRSHSTSSIAEVESDDDNNFYECGQEPDDPAGWGSLSILQPSRSSVHAKRL